MNQETFKVGQLVGFIAGHELYGEIAEVKEDTVVIEVVGDIVESFEVDKEDVWNDE